MMLYVHIPFCKSRCIYCGFFSSTAQLPASERYVEAILREFDLRKPEQAEFETVYIGGGTPSFLPEKTLERLLQGIMARVNVPALREYTVEVNPDDVSETLLEMLRRYGVNRISMGVQSFDDNQLRFIGRRHDSATAKRAIALLKEGGWNFSLDLIYGLPGQTPESWQNQLDTLLDFEPPHFSAYLLSYEEGTRLYSMEQKGELSEADDNTVAEMYAYLCEAAAEKGYRHYEISNFARAGSEAVHNSGYWAGRSYLGLGAGASGFVAGRREFNPESIGRYTDSLSEGRIITESETETDSEVYDTLLFIRLRTASGISLSDIPDVFRPHFLENVKKMQESGLITEPNTGRYVIPEQEWLRSDYIIRNLMY